MTPTILVVEDEPAIQELIVINLKHAGFLAVRAGSAEEAESAIRAEVRNGADVPALKQRLGCGTVCGSCVPQLTGFVHQATSA